MPARAELTAGALPWDGAAGEPLDDHGPDGAPGLVVYPGHVAGPPADVGADGVPLGEPGPGGAPTLGVGCPDPPSSILIVSVDAALPPLPGIVLSVRLAARWNERDPRESRHSSGAPGVRGWLGMSPGILTGTFGDALGEFILDRFRQRWPRGDDRSQPPVTFNVRAGM